MINHGNKVKIVSDDDFMRRTDQGRSILDAFVPDFQGVEFYDDARRFCPQVLTEVMPLSDHALYVESARGARIIQ